MKKFLKIPALFILLLSGSLLTGCVASAGTAVVSTDPYYGPYYRPYPRPYYRPYYRPARVYVRPAPVIVRPQRVIVAPRPGYYNNNMRGHRGYRVR
ncbi:MULTISPECIES: hypothetical protein [Hymenobacter]|uniref:Lipoprotein n=1 Tax=Hymenobacter jejuensis TaxID=2502781 RepID=A0A5B7ZX67_9BACT|nr:MULTISPECIES: hypothetical protein [Hymenobacter]MBC6988163.1 hypothetical protein [Hymenobacter sp. BT491]QDA59467.1 hypothetical protein FHG12_04810 [Hymenobacter jejuensis]